MTDQMEQKNSGLEMPTPTLTFEPFAEEANEIQKEEKEPPKPVHYEEEDLLTEQEKAQVESFAGKIELNNTTMILQYGAGAQKKIADFSEKALESVRTKDLGEVGTMLSSLVSELKDFDAEEDKGFLQAFSGSRKTGSGV